MLTHRQSGTRIYRIWTAMKNRCQNPNRSDYKYYGAKGISVCERWQSFELFLEDMGQPPTSKHSIDRIDTQGNYELSNCRWATQSTQIANRLPHRKVFTKAKHISVTRSNSYRVHLTITYGDRYSKTVKSLAQAEDLLDVLTYEQRYMHNLGFQ